MKDLSLYIHIPFCKSRCKYCGFATFAGRDQMQDAYFKALQQELINKSNKCTHHNIVSIYFGGGTPSHVSTEFITQALTLIKESYSLDPKAEITIECNPESLTENKVNLYKQNGFNRFSMGVQSLSDKTLRAIGRSHDRSIALNAISILSKNTKNYSLDFIVGLPHQNIKTFNDELHTILTFHPNHLSFYFLSHDNPLINIFIQDCPNENDQIEIYQLINKQLSKAGYHHYEVSNFALPGYECKHNLRYWRQNEYFGIGLGAHSYFNDTIFYNSSSLESYLKDPEASDELIHLDTELSITDKIMLNLRTSTGLNLDDFEKELQNTLLKKAEPFIKSSHLAITPENNLHATERGFLILEKITNDLTGF